MLCYGRQVIEALTTTEDNSLSNTFQIHIELTENTDIPGYTKVAKKHNLALKEKDGWLIVYKPYPSVKCPEER
jgi:hypothetical protein